MANHQHWHAYSYDDGGDGDGDGEGVFAVRRIRKLKEHRQHWYSADHSFLYESVHDAENGKNSPITNLEAKKRREMNEGPV